MKYTTQIFLLTLIMPLFSVALPQKRATEKPNVIFILADDMGYNDIACYGQTKIKTPNIDKMAEQGLRFTSFYVSPICTPTRASLMTGCYPYRVGLPFVVAPKGPEWTWKVYNIGLNPEEETLAELLKLNGYATACIGKWHLGHHKQHLPTNNGFDEFYGLLYSNDMLEKNGYGKMPLMENEKVIEYNPDQSLLTKSYTQRALSFISRNSEKPFFLYLAHSMPHVPLYRSKSFEGSSRSGVYGDVIQEVDWSVGEVLQQLEKLNLTDNTIVFFASDNGPWLIYGEHAGSAFPFREGKHTVFEGGTRVPFIALWPKHFPKGKTSDQLTGIIDIVPTICELTGAKLPEKKIDGKSIANLLLGKQDASGRAVQFYGKSLAVAVRKGKWKLHLAHPYHHVMVPGKNGQKGEAEEKNIELSLFNLEVDPGEAMNVAEKYPQIVIELKSEIEKFNRILEIEKREPGIVSNYEK